jgi:hypothetical protein
VPLERGERLACSKAALLPQQTASLVMHCLAALDDNLLLILRRRE